MKISVVTISYNEVANIKVTMDSVFGQTYPGIEYIVQDGGSTDGTVEVVKKAGGESGWTADGRSSFSWMSERDGGIYFGMNKGLERCTGDYVIFCNAGDALAADDVIAKMVETAEKNKWPDLVYGDCASEENGKRLIRTAHGPGFMRFGMPASHEAMMYKLTLVRELGLKYDTSYRIAADYKFTYQFVTAAKTFAYAKIPVVVFSEGGVSTANKWKGLSEACRVRREVGRLSLAQRAYIRLAQSAALLLSTYARPLYRMIRLRGGRSI